MSKLRLNGASSGYVEIQAPDTASNNTITLSTTTDGTLLAADSSGNVNLDSGTFYVDAANNRVGVGTTAPGSLFTLSGGEPALEFYNSNGPTDNKRWKLRAIGTELRLQAFNDAGGGGGRTFAFNRTDEFIDSFEANSAGSAWFIVDNTTSRVGIGITSPQTSLHIQKSAVSSAPSRAGATLYLENNSNCEIQFVGNSANDCQLRFGTSSNSFKGALEYQLDVDALIAYTNSVERARITSGGVLFVSTTSLPSTSSFGTQIGNGYLGSYRNVGSTAACAQLGGNSGQVWIFGDGDLENTNNRYTGLSDARIKENIVDARSQWDDIKALQIRNYNLIASPEKEQLGVIAQELELVSPGLVIERESEDGEKHKSVAYSVLYMKAVKALQEAMERIETLESEVQALKGGN